MYNRGNDASKFDDTSSIAGDLNICLHAGQGVGLGGKLKKPKNLSIWIEKKNVKKSGVFYISGKRLIESWREGFI